MGIFLIFTLLICGVCCAYCYLKKIAISKQSEMNDIINNQQSLPTNTTNNPVILGVQQTNNKISSNEGLSPQPSIDDVIVTEGEPGKKYK